MVDSSLTHFIYTPMKHILLFALFFASFLAYSQESTVLTSENSETSSSEESPAPLLYDEKIQLFNNKIYAVIGIGLGGSSFSTKRSSEKLTQFSDESSGIGNLNLGIGYQFSSSLRSELLFQYETADSDFFDYILDLFDDNDKSDHSDKNNEKSTNPYSSTTINANVLIRLFPSDDDAFGLYALVGYGIQNKHATLSERTVKSIDPFYTAGLVLDNGDYDFRLLYSESGVSKFDNNDYGQYVKNRNVSFVITVHLFL